MKNIVITLIEAGTNPGPFDIYLNDGVSPYFNDVSRDSLIYGYYCEVPDDTVTIKIVSDGRCVSETSCVIPTVTPSPTPTPTITPSATPTCITPTFDFLGPYLTSSYIVAYTPDPTRTCVSVKIDWSRDVNFATYNSQIDTGCSGFQYITVGDITGTWYFRISQLCEFSSSSSYAYRSYVYGATPTPTPTITPTPTCEAPHINDVDILQTETGYQYRVEYYYQRNSTSLRLQWSTDSGFTTYDESTVFDTDTNCEYINGATRCFIYAPVANVDDVMYFRLARKCPYGIPSYIFSNVATYTYQRDCSAYDNQFVYTINMPTEGDYHIPIRRKFNAVYTFDWWVSTCIDNTSGYTFNFFELSTVSVHLSAGPHTIRIVTNSKFEFVPVHFGNSELITSIINWGGNPNFAKISLEGCYNLTSIPSNALPPTVGNESFERMFYNCSSLTSIPHDLFHALLHDSTNDLMFYETFYNCKSLSQIPSDIFTQQPNITGESFVRTFWGCSSIAAIPSGLFNNNINVTSFKGTFYNCKLVSSIPSNLFDNQTNVTTFDSTFSHCESISTIPAYLFDHNTLVTSFANTFEYCSSLTTLPAGPLFANNINVKDYSGTFSMCHSLTAISSGLFASSSDVTTFEMTFNYCDSITSIPSNLFRYTSKVTTYSRTFSYCKSLTTIPSGLFDYSINVENFNSTFLNCESLIGIPVGLFNNNLIARHFAGTFSNCYKLEINQYVFSNTLTQDDLDHRFDNVNASITESVDFNNMFYRDRIDSGYSPGTAVPMWSYKFNLLVFPYKCGCFGGDGNTTLTNYSDIPSIWRRNCN